MYQRPILFNKTFGISDDKKHAAGVASKTLERFFFTFTEMLGLKKYFLIAGFIFCSAVLFAQAADSTKAAVKSPSIQYYQEKDFAFGKAPYTAVDTSMDGVQNYFPKNNFPYSLNLANRRLIFDSSPYIGFKSGFDDLDLFGYHKDDLKYYHTRTPYTEVSATFGMKKEQFSRLLHTQNITKQWNISLNMLRLRSEGFYQHQNCTDNNISFATNYVSKNNRYSVLANGSISSVKTDENGGIPADTFLTKHYLVDKKLFPVNLTDPRTKRGYREAYVKQSLYFGKKENIMKGDSIIGHRIQPKHSLSYSINVSDNWFAYSETNPNSGYYEHVYWDSVKTLDSTHVFTFQNTVSWKSMLIKNVAAEISFDQKTSHVYQYEIDSLHGLHKGENRGPDSTIKENTVHWGIGKSPLDFQANGFYWNLNGSYIVSGNYQGDYLTSGQLLAVFKHNKKIFFQITDNYHSSPFIYSSYVSNHFEWLNSFNKISETRVRINYTDSKNQFSIGGETNQITGYVYFDSTFSPNQFNDPITIYSAFLQKNFHLGKFHFNNKITWQQASGEVIHLPQYATNHSLYYQDAWFSKALYVQIGFDISYYSAYYGDAYMPALGQYYLQYRQLIGNYPYVDFFFNMKIKRARIFFKTEHVNSGLMGGNYFLAPLMPAPDRSFKVGIKWLFYD